MTDPITAAIVLRLVNNALEFSTTGMNIYRDRVAAAAKDREQRETRAFEETQREADRQHARELYIQARRDKLDDDLRALKAARDLDHFRVQLTHYPVFNGPGTLRQSINLLHGDPQTMPPLVLLVPSHADGDATWRPLSHRLLSAVMPLQDKDLAVVRLVDRHLSWPDAAFVENDLYDLPTIVVLAEVFTGWFTVSLGGCNLGGDFAVRHLTQLASLPLPNLAYWTEPRLASLEATSKNNFQRPSPLDTPSAEHVLQLEWVTRISLVAIVAAIDAYHLIRRCGYAEQLDETLALLGPELSAPLIPSFDEGAVADPAYHLLHRARRQWASGAGEAAAESVSAALEVLAGHQQLAAPDAIRAARSTGQLEPWHQTLLEELAAAAPGGALVPPAAIEALHKPLPGTELATVTDPARRQAEPKILEGRPIPGTWVGRPVPETSRSDPDAPRSEW